MDKISRIHIAKIPYEIGHTAEAALTRYLDDIRDELDADVVDDTMADIEVRMTEILHDRHVERDGVVTLPDIKAMQEQLGSPEQINGDDPGSRHRIRDADRPKKLLRDPDNAVLCGVASGLGAYFDLDANIIRIIFVVLIFFGGLGLLLYALLWLLVPAAKTNSDKLLMRGQPVTAANLQHYRNATQRLANLGLRRCFSLLFKLFRLSVTAAGLLLILAFLSALGVLSAALYTQPLRPIYTAYHTNYVLVGLAWLFCITVIGLIIIMLLRLWQKRQLLLKAACFSLLGVLIVTIAALSVVSPIVVSHYKNLYGDDALARAIPMTGQSTVQPQTLLISADTNLDVSYIVTNQPMHATYQSYPGMGRPQLSIADKAGVITMTAHNLPSVVPDCILKWCKNIYLPIRIKLYGPALTTYTASGGVQLDLGDFDQSSLALSAQNNSTIAIDNGYSSTLNLTADTNSVITAGSVTANNTTVQVDATSTIEGLSSADLKATLPGNCYGPALLLAQTPIVTTVNGQSVTSDSLQQNSCVNVDDGTPFAPPTPSVPMMHRR